MRGKGGRETSTRCRAHLKKQKGGGEKTKGKGTTAYNDSLLPTKKKKKGKAAAANHNPIVVESSGKDEYGLTGTKRERKKGTKSLSIHSSLREKG